ncbi:MAG: RsmB/NOP family class I SAM-dependent RNA methyltransferase, partial [Shimia sp.]
PAARALAERATIWIRINRRRADRASVQRQLEADGYECAPHPSLGHALRVHHPARGLQAHPLHLDGAFEFQDASAQAAAEAVPLSEGTRVLDYCAGGGGKALALADRGAHVTAHDADWARMSDLPKRTARAEVHITRTRIPSGLFDVVVCDVPCSGSGTWSRAIGTKWTLTEAELSAFRTRQLAIIEAASRFIAPNGILSLMTCSILPQEGRLLAEHIAQSGWYQLDQTVDLPGQDRDGFFHATFRSLNGGASPVPPKS